MKKHNTFHGLRLIMAAVLISPILLILGTSAAHGHGGKTHTGEPFSALQAVQKATRLYDRLIVSKKLPEGWETDLSTIEVMIRVADGNREYVVKFKRSAGDPDSVYFYFNRQGEYSGSNFTGK